ncbi:MAG TPA: preprotein translocase subunit YajC [Eubacterium sp.]|nr:preprotein translocase subunit YajC [Eubacterium sp.]HBZ53707.1 preprotein translocase subunit YajC [Eubacterium sp.]
MLLAASPNLIIIVVYVLVLLLGMYMFVIGPNKKQQRQQKEMLEGLKPGDAIMTTGGFYGFVVAIDDDVVTVEFGGDRHCRIPMEKAAIAKVDKQEDK